MQRVPFDKYRIAAFPAPWIENASWTYKRYLDSVQDVLWTNYVCALFMLCIWWDAGLFSLVLTILKPRLSVPESRRYFVTFRNGNWRLQTVQVLYKDVVKKNFGKSGASRYFCELREEPRICAFFLKITHATSNFLMWYANYKTTKSIDRFWAIQTQHAYTKNED